MRLLLNALARRKKVTDTRMTFYELKEHIAELDDSIAADIDFSAAYYLHWLMDTERTQWKRKNATRGELLTFLDDTFTGHPDVPSPYWRQWFDATLRMDYDADTVAGIEEELMHLDETHRGRPKYRIAARHQVFLGKHDERHYIDIAASSYRNLDDVDFDARTKDATITYVRKNYGLQ